MMNNHIDHQDNGFIISCRALALGGVSTFFDWLFLIGRRLNLFIGDMYNRYTCPLQPCGRLTLKLLIQGHLQSAEVTRIADFKSAYISLIIGHRGLGW